MAPFAVDVLSDGVCNVRRSGINAPARNIHTVLVPFGILGVVSLEVISDRILSPLARIECLLLEHHVAMERNLVVGRISNLVGVAIL